MVLRAVPEQQADSPRDCEYICLASSSLTRSSSTLQRRPPHNSLRVSDRVLTTAPIVLLKQPMGAAAAALATKLFGPGANPLVEVDATNACTSECCEEVELLSSGSSSSEPHTHPSAHESYNTIPPDLESDQCSSGTYVAAPKACLTSGETPGIRL